jgi:hypothetical protein
VFNRSLLVQDVPSPPTLPAAIERAFAEFHARLGDWLDMSTQDPRTLTRLSSEEWEQQLRNAIATELARPNGLEHLTAIDLAMLSRALMDIEYLALADTECPDSWERIVETEGRAVLRRALRRPVIARAPSVVHD